MKKILAFRTDRLGDFIITKQSLNLFLSNKEQFEVDIVASPKNYDYIKNFKSFNKIYIFKGSYIDFFIKNSDILKKKYNYLILYDGKKRSHIISFFLKGKKISLSKSKNLFKIAKFFKYTSVFNSDFAIQLENFNFVNLLLDQKNKEKKDFYFDYEFKKLDFELPLNKNNNFIFHLDEKWFSQFYYHDFDYCEWDNDFFYKFINKIFNKYRLPIVITTGRYNVPFLNNIKKDFIEIKKNIFLHTDYKNDLIIVDNLSFREIETILKNYAFKLLCCEGGVSHLAHNLNIKTIALYQDGRDVFYKHWTGHMKNITLIKRGGQEHLLEMLDSFN